MSLRTQYADDPMVNGEFDVIKDLLEKLPGAKEAKVKVTSKTLSAVEIM